ncbi:MAG: hypothetical protein O3B64_02850 [bacterium]|nr:hypothetical protein [bacterium]
MFDHLFGGVFAALSQANNVEAAENMHDPSEIREVKSEFHEHERFRRMHRAKLRAELPDDFEEMSEEERRDWFEARHEEAFEERFGVEMPDDWREMTREERGAWFEAQGIEKPERPFKRGEKIEA